MTEAEILISEQHVKWIFELTSVNHCVYTNPVITFPNPNKEEDTILSYKSI